MASAQINSAPNSDPTYGGIFNTAPPAFNPDEPTQYPADKQDAFDFKLMQVKTQFKKPNINQSSFLNSKQIYFFIFFF